MISALELVAIAVISGTIIYLRRPKVGSVYNTYGSALLYGLSSKTAVELEHFLAHNHVSFQPRGSEETASAYASRLREAANAVPAKPAQDLGFPLPPLPWNVFPRSKLETPVFDMPTHRTADAAFART